MTIGRLVISVSGSGFVDHALEDSSPTRKRLSIRKVEDVKRPTVLLLLG